MTQENKDIQPQAEPHIVKSHDIHINSDYADWMVDIKSRYLFYAEKIEKLKQLVLVNGTEKMHQVGGELQFAVNQGVISQVRAIGCISSLTVAYYLEQYPKICHTSWLT